jgi:gamma-glutamyl:cysteine ligase YbdK (ATP-grasp superfamily)
MSRSSPLHLFEGFGIELEYMIVARDGLSVHPVADELLHAVGGSQDNEVALGPVAWSNELARHVVEIKTNGPVPQLSGVAATLQEHVTRINTLLARLDAQLMPTAMHPWMDPHRELALWPHQNDFIYATFDRIFDCRGHGWANLQSTHINLPFADDDEFGRLHAAIRLVLPLLPALAASSPVADGRLTGLRDTRLEVYRHNADRIPVITGRVIPEPVFSRADYEARILAPIAAALAPHDPDGVLEAEWVNSRGCIARFERMAIEIRVLDIQECPQADLAVAALVCATVRALVEERLCPAAVQRDFATEELAALLDLAIRDGECARVDSRAYLAALGHPGSGPVEMGALWRHLHRTVLDEGGAEWAAPLAVLLEEGPLAARIARALGPAPPRDRLREVYTRLCRCLATGTMFHADVQ